MIRILTEDPQRLVCHTVVYSDQSRHVEMLLDLGGDGIGDIAEFGLWAE